MPEWRKYERLIFREVRRLVGDEPSVQFDASIPGRFSRVMRQVDVFVEGVRTPFEEWGARPVTVAIDCKFWNRPIDVAGADQFIGTLEDLGADHGILVSNHRCIPAAQARIDACRGADILVVRPHAIHRAFDAYCVNCKTKRSPSNWVEVTTRMVDPLQREPIQTAAPECTKSHDSLSTSGRSFGR